MDDLLKRLFNIVKPEYEDFKLKLCFNDGLHTINISLGDGANWTDWNPLKDYGSCMKLVERFKINILHARGGGYMASSIMMFNNDPASIDNSIDCYNQNLLVAVCEAIVKGNEK